jgi:hypothetical protein
VMPRSLEGSETALRIGRPWGRKSPINGINFTSGREHTVHMLPLHSIFLPLHYWTHRQLTIWNSPVLTHFDLLNIWRGKKKKENCFAIRGSFWVP